MKTEKNKKKEAGAKINDLRINDCRYAGGAMDNLKLLGDVFAHSLCGWILARAGANRLGPWVTPTLVFAANAPDVADLFSNLGLRLPWAAPVAYLSQCRELSHSLIGLLVQSLALALLVWALGWVWRAKLHERPRLWAAVLISALGVFSHLLLDWFNTYGVRPWLPWNGTWYYGDMVSIVDPWMWLILGAGVFLGVKQSWGVRMLCLFLCAAATSVFLFAVRTKMAPWWTFGVWLALLGLVALLGVTVFNARPPQAVARVCLLFWTVYLAALLVGSRTATRQAFDFWKKTHAGASLFRISANPRPAVPWRFDVLAQTKDDIERVDVDLLRGTLKFHPLNPALKANLNDQVLLGIQNTEEYRAWRAFARHPVWERRGNQEVRLGDMRYRLLEQDDWSELSVPAAP